MRRRYGICFLVQSLLRNLTMPSIVSPALPSLRWPPPLCPLPLRALRVCRRWRTLLSATALGVAGVAAAADGAGDAGPPARAASAAESARADTSRRDGGGAGAESLPFADMDLGEAGELIRQLERGARQGPAAPSAATERLPRGELPPLNGPARRPDTPVRPPLPTNDSLADDHSAGRPGAARSVGEGGASDYRNSQDPGVVRAVADLASPEQRNVVRELVMQMKAVFNHPAVWLVLSVIAAAAVVMSIGRNRRR